MLGHIFLLGIMALIPRWDWRVVGLPGSHNLESQKLQYAMQDRLHQLGWKEIEVIDEDLGRSAAVRKHAPASNGWWRRSVWACRRSCRSRGFAICPNSREWQQLVEVCRIVDTVLIDQETVYAPRQSNDRLLLGLKGSLNEYELDLLRQRSLEARREKAKRGELIIAAPVGYLKTEDQRLEKIRIGACRTPSAWCSASSARWIGASDVALVPGARPAVAGCTPRGEIQWKRPNYGTVYRILTNPIYGGAYAYGKTDARSITKAENTRKRDRRKPRDQWLALIPNAHDGYVDWDEFERIQRAIMATCVGPDTLAHQRTARPSGGTVALSALREQADGTLHG